MTTPCWLTYPKSILISQNTSYCTSSEASVSTVNQDKRTSGPQSGTGELLLETSTAQHSQRGEPFFRHGTPVLVKDSSSCSYRHFSTCWRNSCDCSVLSIRFLLCVLMYVNLGLVRLLWPRKQNARLHRCQKRRRLADGGQQGRFVVGGVQAQSVIKVLVLFHRERRPFLFFLLVSFHFVCRISARRPELWRRALVQGLWGEPGQFSLCSQSALAW